MTDTFHADLARLRPELLRRALYFGKTFEFAEDLVHETFLRALRFRVQYKQGTSLRAWTMQILYSVFISHCRKRSRERRAYGRYGADPILGERESKPAPMMKLLPSTQACLDSLPPLYRVVIEEVDLGQKTYQEVATELSIPLGTVMSRLHRGRRMLAEGIAA